MSKSDFKKTPQIKKIDVMDFINGAESHLNDVRSNDVKKMPWDSARPDVIKLMNVRMPEEYYIKLDHLSKKHRISKNKLCLEAVIAEIDRMLSE